jgi:hypothetical protein
MAHIYRFASLNINGITSQTKMAMLADFVTKQDIDVLLQEVSTIIPVSFGDYVIHHMAPRSAETCRRLCIYCVHISMYVRFDEYYNFK